MSQLELFAAFLAENGVAFERDVALKDRCTFRIGGPASLVIEPANTGEIAAAARYAGTHDIPLTVLGRGSNVLFSDDGYPGALLHLGNKFAAIRDLDDTTIACDSGLKLSRLCEHALERGLSGLEFAYGIPGTVGGGVYMNAGAYGGELSDVLVYTDHLEPDGTSGRLTGPEMELCYRHSAYSGTGRIITGATVRLRPGDPAEIRANMDDCMSRRRQKQPLEYPSAGSTFKRPVGGYASALIDQCGLKGLRRGGAMVSEKHAGFVINVGNATCRDVLEVVEAVRSEVERQTGFVLECEIKVIEGHGPAAT